jgi:hypothetical protein
VDDCKTCASNIDHLVRRSVGNSRKWVAKFSLSIHSLATTTLWRTEKQWKEKKNQRQSIWCKFRACWPYFAQESPWCRVGFTTYLVVGGLLSKECNFRLEFHFVADEVPVHWGVSRDSPSPLAHNGRAIPSLRGLLFCTYAMWPWNTCGCDMHTLSFLFFLLLIHHHMREGY